MKAMENHLMNSTSLEKNPEPCLWFLLRLKSSMQCSLFKTNSMTCLWFPATLEIEHATQYWSGSRFETMLPRKENESLPYSFVLVFGSWKWSFIRKLFEIYAFIKPIGMEKQSPASNFCYTPHWIFTQLINAYTSPIQIPLARLLMRKSWGSVYVGPICSKSSMSCRLHIVILKLSIYPYGGRRDRGERGYATYFLQTMQKFPF